MAKSEITRSLLADEVNTSPKTITLLLNNNSPPIDPALEPMLAELGYEIDVIPKGDNGTVAMRLSEVVPESSKLIPEMWQKVLEYLGLELVAKPRAGDNTGDNN